MTRIPRLTLLNLPNAAQAALVAGARDPEPVRGLTHGFYKYPARFSPSFVRAAIKTFTQPADIVLDNHVGGGTTLVEALSLGRHALGVDISPLAEFVTSVKTTVFEEEELNRLAAWAKQLPRAVDLRKWSIYFSDHADLGYYKHLDHPSRWRLRKAIEQGLGSAIQLDTLRLESFGRCVVLRTAQWALDGRKQLPSIAEFRDMLTANALEMINGARQLLAEVRRYAARPTISVIHRSAAGLETDGRIRPVAGGPEREILVGRVVDCSGPLGAFSKAASPLLQGLLQSGDLKPDPLDLGLDVTAEGAAIDREGQPSRRLFALGPLTKGVFWETTAVPDIRVQCERLAERILALVQTEACEPVFS